MIFDEPLEKTTFKKGSFWDPAGGRETHPETSKTKVFRETSIRNAFSRPFLQQPCFFCQKWWFSLTRLLEKPNSSTPFLDPKRRPEGHQETQKRRFSLDCWSILEFGSRFFVVFFFSRRKRPRKTPQKPIFGRSLEIQIL